MDGIPLCRNETVILPQSFHCFVRQSHHKVVLHRRPLTAYENPMQEFTKILHYQNLAPYGNYKLLTFLIPLKLILRN